MSTQTELFEVGIKLSAAGLIFGAFFLLIAGAASGLGWSFRSAIEPMLQHIRASSSLSRSELADLSIRISIGFAALAALFGQLFLAVVLVVVLWRGRPIIRRLTTEENRLLAVVGSLSIDLVIGFYVPIVLAQFLLLNLFIGSSLLLVIVALSWPPGGGDTVPGRRWRLAPNA